MSKLFCVIIAIFLAGAMLTACKSNEKAPVASSDASQSEIEISSASEDIPDESAAASSSMPEIIIDKNPNPGQTSMGGKEFSLTMYASDPEAQPATITLTLQQQNAISQELQMLVAKYESGEYPIERPEGEDGAGFYPGWPAGVGYPATVPVKQLIFSTVGHVTNPMSVQVALPKGWYMECDLVVDAGIADGVDYASEDNYWIPVSAHFIDPNGLVHDTPGETAIDGGPAIVLS